MDKKNSLKGKKQKLNKIHSMQYRILATVIFAMLVTTVCIGGTSIYEVDRYIQEESKDLVVVTCENESAKINALLNDMEKSVKVMESYVMEFFTEGVDVKDRNFQEKIINSADKMFADVAKHASGAVAYYVRFNPAISDGTSGLFYSKVGDGDEYVSFEPTNIDIYDKEDTEHVGWFWQPYDHGEPVWMLPYYNKNNNIYMISYVVPMYYEEQFIGVVGIDFDYRVLADMVQEIEIYENGFAYLEMDGVVIHSDDREFKTENQGDLNGYLRVSEKLTNGMTLVLSASYDDVQQIRFEISLEIFVVSFMLSVFFIAAAIAIVRRIVAPLERIADASVKISNGDYNVEFVHSNVSEIQLLNTAFKNMATRLHEREEELMVV